MKGVRQGGRGWTTQPTHRGRARKGEGGLIAVPADYTSQNLCATPGRKDPERGGGGTATLRPEKKKEGSAWDLLRGGCFTSFGAWSGHRKAKTKGKGKVLFYTV